MTALEAISNYIHDGMWKMPPKEWKELCATYTKDELVPIVVDKILSGEIQFPYRNISIEEAELEFKKLMDYDTSKGIVESVINTKDEYKYPLGNYYIKGAYLGMEASDYFQHKNRMNASSKHYDSPVECWRNPKHVKHIAGGFFTMDWDEMNDQKMRKILNLRCYIASQFKPTVAKIIYERFNARDVLDFSAGWGDRLCGFYASSCTRSYIGIDPNKAVYDVYQKQADFYSQFTDKKEVKFINKPAEEVTLPQNCVDMIFTSPPYFDSEHYCDDDTQSWKRYTTIDSWLNNFLFPTLRNCWSALKPNGYLILNIMDVHDKKNNVLKICDPMNDFIKELGGEYVEGTGMRMSKRPNCGIKDNGGVYVEPIWVWRKNTN